MDKMIRLACVVEHFIPLEDLVPFQGELKSLSKENYEKLRKEILHTGFAFPVHFWRGADGRPYIVGGHQRVRVLQELAKEGFKLRDGVPVVEVLASSYQEAKRRVLQDVGQYGHVEEQGMYEFLHESGVDPEDLRKSFDVPGINMDQFIAGHFGVTKEVSFTAKAGAKELDEGEFQEFDHQCPKCGFHFDSPKAH